MLQMIFFRFLIKILNLYNLLAKNTRWLKNFQEISRICRAKIILNELFLDFTLFNMYKWNASMKNCENVMSLKYKKKNCLKE